MSRLSETWAPIPGAPSYEASDLGRVRRVGASKGARVGHVLKTWVNVNGYECIVLYLGAGVKPLRTRVHRLVWAAFHGDPGDLVVDHVDGVKLNNKLANLEAVTSGENNRRAIAMGLRKPTTSCGQDRYNARFTEDDVRRIRAMRKQGMKLHEIGAAFECSVGTIANITLGKAWKHVADRV